MAREKGATRLKKIISKFKEAKILVIGDLILDEFIWGSVSRISPEAPVPVVWVNSESFMPGGASNVANNIHSLGGEVCLAGVVGNDERGRTLCQTLHGKGINIEGVIIDNERPTTLKTRIIAHHQQVVRVDREKVGAIEDNLLNQIITYVKEIISDIDGVIIEDYGKGIVAPKLLQEVVPLVKKYKKIITVDPKEEHFSYYHGVTAITPNQKEAEEAVGVKGINKMTEGVDEATLHKVGRELLRQLRCEGILITLGEHGMRLFEASGKTTHIPTVAQEVFDVSGAGDTVISCFTLALAAGASMVEAAHLSNYAAGIVVGKVGIAVATQEELLSRMSGE